MDASVPLNIRIKPATRNLIDRAAELLGKTRTDFMLEASERRAEEVLLDRTVFTVSPEVYARLVAHVRGTFARDAKGERSAFAGRGYTVHDTFYAANGHFSPVRTCNEWVREALAASGVRVPLWAPLPYAMF